MWFRNFLKKLLVFNVLFGAKKTKLSGIIDKNSTITDTDFIFTTSTNSIQLPNQTTLPDWLVPGKFFRIYDGIKKSTDSVFDADYEDDICGDTEILNCGVLFKVLYIDGNTIFVDPTIMSPVDRIEVGNMTIDGRVAIVINNSDIARINKAGNSVYCTENTETTDISNDGSGIASASADHYHDVRSSFNGLVTAELAIDNIVQDNGYGGNAIDLVVIDEDGDVVYR